MTQVRESRQEKAKLGQQSVGIVNARRARHVCEQLERIQELNGY